MEENWIPLLGHSSFDLLTTSSAQNAASVQSHVLLTFRTSQVSSEDVQYVQHSHRVKIDIWEHSRVFWKSLTLPINNHLTKVESFWTASKKTSDNTWRFLKTRTHWQTEVLNQSTQRQSCIAGSSSTASSKAMVTSADISWSSAATLPPEASCFSASFFTVSEEPCFILSSSSQSSRATKMPGLFWPVPWSGEPSLETAVTFFSPALLVKYSKTRPVAGNSLAFWPNILNSSLCHVSTTFNGRHTLLWNPSAVRGAASSKLFSSRMRLFIPKSALSRFWSCTPHRKSLSNT